MRRVLSVQSLSCFGKSSLTVALPVLSAMGCSCTALPTAVLSTHTGYPAPHCRSMTEDIPQIAAHWQSQSINFDVVMTGYLADPSQADAVLQVVEAFGKTVIVDPAMGDGGKLYRGLDTDHVDAMKRLCRKANVLLPNVTEAAMFAGREYRENMTEEYVSEMLDALDHPCVILTGTGYQSGMSGVTIREKEAQFLYTHSKLGKNYHGTGDMFAACFTGALLCGRSKPEAARIAADFVCKAIEKTMENPAHWYGVKFEAALPDLIRMLQ